MYRTLRVFFAFIYNEMNLVFSKAILKGAEMQKQTGYIVFVFVCLVVPAMGGGSWNVAQAQGSVPPEPPPPEEPAPAAGPAVPPAIAPTIITVTGEGLLYEISDLGSVVAPTGAVEEGYELATAGELETDLPEGFSERTPGIRLTVTDSAGNEVPNYTFGESVVVTFELSADDLAAYLADGDVGIYYYDEINEEWIKVDVTLVGDTLVAEVDNPGLYVVGKPTS